MGQVVITEVVMKTTGQQQHRMNLENLSEGSYILTLEMNGKIIKTDNIQVIR